MTTYRTYLRTGASRVRCTVCASVGLWLTGVLWIALLLVLPGCDRATDAGTDGYTYLETASPHGTGKVYMGREIARMMDTTAAEHLDRPAREVQEMPRLVLEALPLTPASVVADIGAGTGYFTLRIAERVPDGQVFAVDIQEALLAQVHARATAAGLTHVTPVQGAVDDPRLPTDSIDVALIVDAYNEFSHPREMMQAIRRALRPGGQLVVVEFRGEDETVPLPDLHRMTEAQLRRELEAVGFRWRETRDMLPQQHYLVFDSPAEGRSTTN